MHMADTLISPAIGGIMWVASAGLMAHCSKKLRQHLHGEALPLMGVLGAFIFAAQMINFTIPGTGSSGHLGGAMLLALLLGPYAAFLTIASVLTVQALFFADGGLLALGCNMFNLGFFPCFVAYPLLYRPLVGAHPSRARLMGGAVLACVVGLQLGAFGVVLETLFSGISELPFAVFALLMQPIHLAIGLVEGFVTAVVALFVWHARPELLTAGMPGMISSPARPARMGRRGLAATFAVAACMVGGVLSWYASEHPDGLEWAMARTATTSAQHEPAPRTDGVYGLLTRVQQATALLPEYAFTNTPAPVPHATPPAEPRKAHPDTPQTDPRLGTSVAGLAGGLLTLTLAGGLGLLLRRRQRMTV